MSAVQTENSIFLGPFFYFNRKLITHKIPIAQAEKRIDKCDNPFSHEALFETIDNTVDYIEVPRGRVIWDSKNNHAIIYIDVCLEKKIGLIKKIAQEFCLTKYVIESDLHYRCKKCLKNLKM